MYELELTRRLCDLARRGGTFVDVGANLGYFSLLWAAQNPGNRCVAFEASPRNLDLLRRNVARNSLGGRVEVAVLRRPVHWRGPLNARSATSERTNNTSRRPGR